MNVTPAGGYPENTPSVPPWLSNGDNGWQMMAATLVGLQSMPGLVILYASYARRKWAVNSAFMALYAFAAVLVCWVAVGYRLAFGEPLIGILGMPGQSLDRSYLTGRAILPATVHRFSNGTVEMNPVQPFFPMSTLVYFQFNFAAITTILVAGSVLERMCIKAWMVFVPLWLIFCYTFCTYSLWGGGFLYHWGVIDYSGGYVVHLSSGISGFTAAFCVGPRLKADRENHVSNNILLLLTGAGLLWMGWSGFNGGAPYSASIISSIAIFNTNISAATGLLVWISLDVLNFKRPSAIGAIQGMITGLACITPAAGLVQPWAALIYGALAGIIPWYAMMYFHNKTTFLHKVDDTMGVFYTHAVAGILGGLLTGIFAHPDLCNMLLPVKNTRGVLYGDGGSLLLRQLFGALFIVAWNSIVTFAILKVLKLFIPLRMENWVLEIGDRQVHGENVYEGWGDKATYDNAVRVTNQNGRTQVGEGPSVGSQVSV